MKLVALCTLMTFCTVLATTSMEEEISEYARVTDLIVENMRNLRKVMNQAIFSAQDGFNRRSNHVPFRPLMAQEDNATVVVHSNKSEKCQREAIANLQPHLERMKAIYANGSRLLQRLRTYYDSCMPAEGAEQLSCTDRKMIKYGFTEENFINEAMSAIADAQAASKVAIRKISSCFFAHIVVNPVRNTDQENDEEDEEEESRQRAALVRSREPAY